MSTALSIIDKFYPQSEIVDVEYQEVKPFQPQAFYGDTYGYNRVYNLRYDGEKNLGEMGPLRRYLLDHYALKVRSRQLYIESEICQTVIHRFTDWVIGGGLILQAEPQIDVLKVEGISVEAEEFNKSIESRWKVYANSKLSDMKGKMTLNELQAEALEETKIGGDILVVLNVVNGLVKVRHIDGAHVMNPTTAAFNGTDYVAPNGNRIRWGIELDSAGRHVAYWVRLANLIEFERIEAIGKKSGMVMAYMVCGLKYTIDSERGMPLIAVVMETAKKLERYTSAALGGAEERQKIALFFEHGQSSNNEDPTVGQRAKAAAGFNNVAADLPIDINANQLANQVAASTNKTVYNLPNDVTIKAIESKQEVHVQDFGMFNIDLICAAVGIPPNVAMSKYEDSFSASRMAGKDWEHTFMNERKTFSQQYLNPIYALQTYVWVHQNKITAPGYLTAITQKNEIAVASYLHCRWVGDKFPDIDPLKTANALRVMLGHTADHLPMITMEAAAEQTDQGEFTSIINQVAKELEQAKALGIEREDKLTGVPIEGGAVENPPKKTVKKKVKSKPAE